MAKRKQAKAARSSHESKAQPQAGKDFNLVRSVVVMSPEMQNAFNIVMGNPNPLSQAVMYGISDIHRIPEGTLVKLAGIILDVFEQRDELNNPKSSPLIHRPGIIVPK